MKTIILLVSLSLLLPASTLRAEDSPLEKQMQSLGRGMKRLGQQITDPSKQQENVTLLELLKQASVASKGLDPRKTSAVPEADRQKFLSEYHSQMDKLTGALNAVEDAVKAGQYDHAKSLLSSVNSIKKEGHQQFKQD